jgi:hypothetical protein
MEQILLRLVLASIISLLLPKWALLVYCVPILMIFSFMEMIPPILSLLEADIEIFDYILFIIGIRIAGPILLGKQKITLNPILLPAFIFLSVLLGATIIAYYRFGEEIFISEVIAFLRMVTQIITFLFFIRSIRTEKELALTHKSLEYIGYIIAFTIYINFILYPLGLNLGEVMSSDGITRYFGPIGDQVSFILIFFIVKKLIDRKWISAAAFAGALLATGTRAAVIPLGIGIGMMAFKMRKEVKLTAKQVTILIIVCIILSSFTIIYDVGGLKSRLSGSQLELGLKQRILTTELALDVFLDNFLTGVGFTGFRFLSLDYGAWAVFTKNLYFSPNFVATAGNQFLQAATDGGILGLVSFVWLSVVIVKVLKKAIIYSQGESYSHSLASYIWFLSLLVGNLTNAWLLPGSLISYFLWIILGFAVAKRHLLSAQLVSYYYQKGQFNLAN